jgi:hypothetical protein
MQIAHQQIGPGEPDLLVCYMNVINHIEAPFPADFRIRETRLPMVILTFWRPPRLAPYFRRGYRAVRGRHDRETALRE